ncbi:MAG: hypothetical protein M1127_00535 [Patescibacteria group bacterium]|nr:hypothetical protein [Patescibacteria group bacterium]
MDTKRIIAYSLAGICAIIAGVILWNNRAVVVKQIAQLPSKIFEASIVPATSSIVLDASKDGPIYGDPVGLQRVRDLETELHNMVIRPDHPRLFITKETLPTYQARVKMPQLAAYWANIKKAATSTNTNVPFVYDNMVNAAFAYLMLKDDNPAAAAVYSNIVINRLKTLNPTPWPLDNTNLKRNEVANMALAFDWVYSAMTPADRATIANKIGVAANIAVTAQGIRNGERIQGESFHREEWMDKYTLAYPTLALAGEFPDADFCFKAWWGYDWIVGDAVRTFAYLGDGSFPNDGYYEGPDGAEWLLLLKSATGINLVDGPKWSWAKKTADQFFYHTDFWDRKREIFHHGVLGECAVGLMTLFNYSSSFDPSKLQKEQGRGMALNMNSNPYYRWHLGNLLENKFDFGVGLNANISQIMFNDPAVSPKDPQGATYAELPMSLYMPDGNEVYMHSAWLPKSVIAGFRASPAFTKSSHGDYDTNSFMIYRDGNLSADTGFYDAYLGGQANTKHYQKITLSHNDILVIDPTRPQDFSQWAGMEDRGGVEHVSTKNFSASPATDGLRTVFALQPQANYSDIVKYESTPEYDYAVGEAAAAYGLGSKARLNEYYRNVAFLRKGTKAYMIVFDRIESVNKDAEKKWLMHFVSEPTVSGNKISEQVSGQVDAYDGDYTVARNVYNTSAVYVKTLLPVQHKIRRVGGTGFEFAVENANGTFTNWPVPQTQLAKYEARQGGPWQEGGTWRIELSPTTRQNRDYFLNVMYVGDAGETMVPVQYIEENGMAGVIINDPALPKNKILFTKTGDPNAVFTNSSVSADTILPAPISQLSYSGLTYNSVNLSWTAVGDDGNTGTATRYDLRYSKSAITSSNFDSALNVNSAPTPKPAGQTEIMLLTGLEPLTTYYVAVRAIDDYNNKGGISNVVSFATPAVPSDTQPPAKPLGLKATAQLSTAILLSWAASTDNTSVAGYNVYRDNVKIASVGNPYFTDSGLAASTDYVYQVSAYDGANNESAKSDPVTGTTKSITDQPGGSLLSDNFDDNDMEGWTVVDEGIIVKPSKWYAGNGKLHQDSDIYGPAYSAADHRKGTFAYWNNPAAFAWKDYSMEYTFNTTDIDGVGFMFYYQDKSNYYKIDIDYQKKFSKLFLMKNGVETTLATSSKYYTRFVDQNLKVSINQGAITASLNGDDIFSTVITNNSLAQGTAAIYCWGSGPITFDDVKIVPQGSAVEADTIPPSRPTGLSAAVSSTSTISLIWTPSTDNIGVAGYNIYRDNVKKAESSSPSYTDIGLTASTTYAYQVSAYDGANNESVKSDFAQGTTLGIVNNALNIEFKFDENAGLATADTVGGNNGILTNGPVWQTGFSCQSGSCLRFDGINDYVKVNDNDSLSFSNLTVSAWVKFNKLALSGIVSKRNYLGSQDEYNLFYNASNRHFIFRVAGKSGTGQYAYYSINPSLDTWYHIVGTFDGVNTKIYVNGVKGVDGTPKASLNNGTATLKIGSVDSAYFFNGLIDDVRIYNYALTPQEISQLP